MKNIFGLNASFLAYAAAVSGFFVGCGGAEAPGKATTKAACTALFAPEPAPITLEPFMGGPGPEMKPQAVPFAVTLAPTVVQGYWSGHGLLTLPAEATYGIYVSPAATFAVRDAAGNSMPFRDRLGSPTTCDKIDQYGFVHLVAGTYSLELGPAPTLTLRMLLVPTAVEDHL